MALGICDPTLIDKVTDLADSYADQVVSSLHAVESMEQLHKGLSGAFIAFFSEAVLTVNAAA